MVYCEQCGAANDIMNQQCLRCGFQFVPIEDPSLFQPQAVLAPAGRHNGTATPDLESAAGIGAGLELPEWLQRAAAETPEAPSNQPTAPAYPITQPVSPPQMSTPLFERLQQQGERQTPTALPEIQPIRQAPVQAATGQGAMPEWLKTGQPPLYKSAEPEASDTSSFISENDLPEWIRQIGAADTAKRLEDERIAAELQRSAEDVSGSPRNVLPGEAATIGPASNPWLTRKELGNPSSAWSGAPATRPQVQPGEIVIDDNDVRPDVVQVTPEFTKPATKSKVKLAKPSVKLPSMSKPAMPKLSLPKPAADSASPMMRYALIGAVALVVLLLLVMVVL